MLLADNYYHIGDTAKAIQTYRYAANMIPCRFLPLYLQFKIHAEDGNTKRLKTLTKEIVNKQVKIESNTVRLIIKEARNYLKKRRLIVHTIDLGTNTGTLYVDGY